MTHDTHVFASTCPICGGAQKTPNDDLCEFCDGEGYVPMYNGLCYHVPSNPDRFRDQYGIKAGPSCYIRSFGESLRLLVSCELAFSGLPQILSPRKIVTNTHILSQRDETVFEGTPEDMYPLIRVCAAYLELIQSKETREAAIGSAFRMVSRPQEDGTEGVTGFNMAHVMPILVGGSLAKAALILAESLHDIPIEDLTKARLDDLCIVVEMIYEGASRMEAYSLLH